MQLHLLAAALAAGASGLAAQDNTNPHAPAAPASAAQSVRPAPSPAPAGPNHSGYGVRTDTTRPEPELKLGSTTRILVYDQDSKHGFAADAAQNLSTDTTVADASTFNLLLTAYAWDVVAVDCTNTEPVDGWKDLSDYVGAGGAAVLSFWDWDDKPALAEAFDVAVSSSISFGTAELIDAGTAPVFLGVTMPNASWDSHWADDGDRFTLLGDAQGLARLGAGILPVMARGNGGRTIAAPLFDEAGTDWQFDGSGIRLWENMITMVLNADEGPAILVYDEDTEQSLAQKAAFQLSPGRTKLAQSANFNNRLDLGPWDAVLVDAPQAVPAGGWADLIDYVEAGGHVVLSFWDWDASAVGFGDPALLPAFQVDVTSSFGLTGLTLFDSGTSDVFHGVTMPNSSWHGFWFDDGDRFTPHGGAVGLAHVGEPGEPVFVWGNGGRTVAAPVLDESGPEWITDGSAVKLWKNLFRQVTEPEATCSVRTGILGLNPLALTCVSPAVVGGTFTSNVSLAPTLGASTVSTFVAIGLGAPLEGALAFGFELLILPPYLVSTALGQHAIPVPDDATLVGLTLHGQGARLEQTGPTAFIVLTNGLDLFLGF
jgi:hypothetical protein